MVFYKKDRIKEVNILLDSVVTSYKILAQIAKQRICTAGAIVKSGVQGFVKRHSCLILSLRCHP